MAGNKAIIGIFVALILFGGLGVFLYLYFKTNMFKSEGDACVPTDKEFVENTDKKTYEVNDKKACVATSCATGYTIDSATNKCVLASTTPATTSGTPTSGETQTPATTPPSGTPATTPPSGTPATTPPSGTPTPAVYIPPTGVECIPTAYIDNGKQYRKDTAGVCKLVSCQGNYKPSLDGKKCEYKPDENIQSSFVTDCDAAFGGDVTSYCVSDSSAGIRWEWTGAGAKDFCNKQIEYYDVELTSERDPELRFKTKIPAGYSQAAISGLPSAYLKQNMEVKVDAINKEGRSILSKPRYWEIRRDQNRANCDELGIKPTDAYDKWNENNNIYRVSYLNEVGSTALGSFATYDSIGGLDDSGWTGIGARRVYNLPKRQGAGVITNCQVAEGGKWRRLMSDVDPENLPAVNFSTYCHGGFMWIVGDNDTSTQKVNKPPDNYKRFSASATAQGSTPAPAKK